MRKQLEVLRHDWGIYLLLMVSCFAAAIMMIYIADQMRGNFRQQADSGYVVCREDLYMCREKPEYYMDDRVRRICIRMV